MKKPHWQDLNPDLSESRATPYLLIRHHLHSSLLASLGISSQAVASKPTLIQEAFPDESLAGSLSLSLFQRMSHLE